MRKPSCTFRLPVVAVAVAVGLTVGSVPGMAHAASQRGAPATPMVAGTDCASTERRIAALPRSPGRSLVTCLNPGFSAGATTDGAGIQASCGDSWFVAARFVGCGTGTGVLYIVQRPSMTIVGGINYTITMQVTVNGRSDRWVHTWTYRATYAWGQVRGTTITATAICGQACQPVDPPFFEGGNALPGNNYGRSITFGTAIQGTNTSWASSSAWKWHFTSPVTTPPDSETTTWTAPAHRCDNALAGRPVGCTNPSVIPTHEIGRLRYPKYARHVELSINHGLPSLLTRTTSAQADLNRAVACPPNQPRPEGMSCDEYPFASSAQGAASQPYGRTFLIINWRTGDPPFVCHVPWLQPRQGNDSGGYSVCMVPVAENSGGGNDLDIFYYDNRVIVGDQFRVRVV